VRLLAADLQRREKGRGAIMRRGSQSVFFISFLSLMQPLMSIRVPFFTLRDWLLTAVDLVNPAVECRLGYSKEGWQYDASGSGRTRLGRRSRPRRGQRT